MAYLGNRPAEAYSAFQKQDFSTSATTSYTLDHPVANQNEIALFINFVRQEPTAAYTASGTTLTLTSATASSDDMYCVYLGKAVQTVNPPSGSVGLSQLSATGTKDSTTFLRGDNTFATAGEANTPYFFGQLASTVDLSRNVNTKITGLTTNELDSDTAFDGTTFTVPSGKAGKYFLAAQVWVDFDDEGYDGEAVELSFRKNGGSYFFKLQDVRGGSGLQNGSRMEISIHGMMDLSASDYLELYVQAYDQNGGGGGTLKTTTNMFGFRISAT